MRKPVKSAAKENFQKAADQKRLLKEQHQMLKKDYLLVKYLAISVAAFGFISYANTLKHKS